MEQDDKTPETPEGERKTAKPAQAKPAAAPSNGPNQTNAGERS